MHFNSTRRQALCGLGGLLLASLTGCGTILHPERKGQPAGKLDWSVVALDGIGLCFFFIPGVIAFAVDFNNGSIYLPPEATPETADAGASGNSGVAGDSGSRQLVKIDLPQEKLTPAEIESAVEEKTGRQIRLQPGRFVTRTLERIEQFWTVREELELAAV